MATFNSDGAGEIGQVINFVEFGLAYDPAYRRHESYTDLGGGNYLWEIGYDNIYTGFPDIVATLSVRNGVVSGGRLVAGNVFKISDLPDYELTSSYNLFSVATARDVGSGAIPEGVLLATIYRGNDHIDIPSRGSYQVGVTANGYGGNDWIRTGVYADSLSGGVGSDTLLSLNGRDNLNGGSGNDTMEGGGGNDMLIGGDGADAMTGGVGSDTFRYTAKSHSGFGVRADRILDFDDGSLGDRIDLSALFGPAMIYRHKLAFTNVGQVRINDVAGADLIVEVNTGGGLAADFSIRLVDTTLASMTASDFVL